jgi:hypothetical protein
MKCPEVDCGGSDCECRKRNIDYAEFMDNLYDRFCHEVEVIGTNEQEAFSEVVGPYILKLMRFQHLEKPE